jgi:hypothetical protein
MKLVQRVLIKIMTMTTPEGVESTGGDFGSVSPSDLRR